MQKICATRAPRTRPAATLLYSLATCSLKQWTFKPRQGYLSHAITKASALGEIFDDIESFAATLPAMGALAGLDLGTVTIGVAVSDSLLSVATPLETIKRKKFGIDAEALQTIIAKRDLKGSVLGLPFNMDGSEGPRAQSTRAFARNFARLSDLPITFWDERLSPVAAEKALLEADTSRKRRAEVIDHVAAAYIIQGALARIRHIRQAHE